MSVGGPNLYTRPYVGLARAFHVHITTKTPQSFQNSMPKNCQGVSPGHLFQAVCTALVTCRYMVVYTKHYDRPWPICVMHVGLHMFSFFYIFFRETAIDSIASTLFCHTSFYLFVSCKLYLHVIKARFCL